MLFGKRRYEVICVGSTSKDVFFPTDEGVIIETPEDITSKEKIAFEMGGKFLANNRYESVGGVAANIASGLGRLGRHVACYSKVGTDEMGRWALDRLKENGVSTKVLFSDATVKTDLSAIVVIEQNGERIIFHNRDANEKLEIIEEKLLDTEWLFVSALNGDWKGNLRKLLEMRKRHHLKFAFNPGQHNIKEDPRLVLQAIRQADVLFLNKDEAIELIMDSENPLSADELDDEAFLLETLHEIGADVIGMTDGKRGAWSYDGIQMWHCPIRTRTGVVDSTGCGDAFGSGFFNALLDGASIDKALRCGIAQSGSVVGFYGAIEGLLDMKTMNQLIKDIIPSRMR
jgi:sugar/nucleoside kinase (ribokinase family)